VHRNNAHALACYASLCQEGGLVPIVEPEVLMDGDHTIERCHATTAQVLHTVFNQLYGQHLWQGLDTNVNIAQEALLYRAKCNSAARQGKYTDEMEQAEPALVASGGRHSQLDSQD
jgi:fructose-bisphosphate aldolase class 1